MQKAIEIASFSGLDVPVGAVIVKNGKIISYAHNEKEAINDVTAHAEILAIRQAEKILCNWRLSGCDIYVTLEPCPMCLWAILQSRIDNVYFGSFDSLMGGFTTLPQLLSLANSKLNYKGGIMEEDCNKLIHNYFQALREKHNVNN